MCQIPVYALPWNWVSYYLILTLGLLATTYFEDVWQYGAH